MAYCECGRQIRSKLAYCYVCRRKYFEYEFKRRPYSRRTSSIHEKGTRKKLSKEEWVLMLGLTLGGSGFMIIASFFLEYGFNLGWFIIALLMLFSSAHIITKSLTEAYKREKGYIDTEDILVN